MYMGSGLLSDFLFWNDVFATEVLLSWILYVLMGKYSFFMLGTSGYSFAECFSTILSVTRNVSTPSHTSRWPPLEAILTTRKKLKTKKINLLLQIPYCLFNSLMT